MCLHIYSTMQKIHSFRIIFDVVEWSVIIVNCNREWHGKFSCICVMTVTTRSREMLSSGDDCRIALPALRDRGLRSFGVGKVGERREEENGRRGYGKRAGTSCEVRVARHEIASFAIDRAKKGRRSSAGEGPTTSLAIASRVPPSKSHRQKLKPVWSPAVTCRRSLSSVLRLHRF